MDETFFLTHLDNEWTEVGSLGIPDSTLNSEIRVNVIQDDNYFIVASSLLHSFVFTFTTAKLFVPAQAKKSSQRCQYQGHSNRDCRYNFNSNKSPCLNREGV